MEEYITVTAKTVKDAILEASLKLETSQKSDDSKKCQK